MPQHRSTSSFARDLADLRAQGFRIAQISPADDPQAALLVRGSDILELRADGAVVEMQPPTVAPVMPAAAETLVVSRKSDSAEFNAGRAGMDYRDLIPGRQGGRIIGSHIRIPNGGPVDDYVHYHNICFQMIFVHKGWVKVVYEDQGEPFIMFAGDCVLQPPHIRHQVLEASDGLEVIEFGAPAVHDTFGDLAMELPNAEVNSDRDFAGQRFWRHQAARAQWLPSNYEGFSVADLGLKEASAGVASVRVHRSEARCPATTVAPSGQQRLLMVLAGQIAVEVAGDSLILKEGDCLVVPGNRAPSLGSLAASKFLEVHFLGLP